MTKRVVTYTGNPFSSMSEEVESKQEKASRLRASGKTMKEIGRELNVSYQRVSQYLKYERKPHPTTVRRNMIIRAAIQFPKGFILELDAENTKSDWKKALVSCRVAGMIFQTYYTSSDIYVRFIGCQRLMRVEMLRHFDAAIKEKREDGCQMN